MDIKAILGESFLQFNSDFTYIESDKKTQRTVYGRLQMENFFKRKVKHKPIFLKKMELIEVSTDQIQMKNSDKIILTFNRVK